METIKVFVENLIGQCGVSGCIVVWIRHAVMTVVVMAAAWLTDYLCRRILIPLVGRITRRTTVRWDDILLGRPVLSAVGGMVSAIVVWRLLPVVFYQYPVVREVLGRFAAVYMTVAVVRLLMALVNSLRLLEGGDSVSLRQYILSFCGLLKVVIMFIAVIVVIAIMVGRSPMTLFAGLGATSAILMLVFKDTIEGLVAGIRLTSADMLHVGDWITVPSTTADGTVIEMNLTTVKVQNFDNTIVTVSPMTLVNGSFQNWKGMRASDGRRVKRRLYFDFRSLCFAGESREETNMSRYRRDMERYLASHPEVNADMALTVRQLEATQAGLPLEFYFFIRNKEWVHYEHTLASIMEYACVLAGEYGLKIYEQFPEQ